MRPITLAQAQRQFPHRFTMEHVPQHATRPVTLTRGATPVYYAPQYASDQEWYDNTIFPGEETMPRRGRWCNSLNQTWPLGQWLDAPYQVNRQAQRDAVFARTSMLNAINAD